MNRKIAGSPPGDATSRSVARPATRQSTSISRRGKRIPVAIGQYVPAFGRCRFPRVFVRRCPTCGRGPSSHRVINSAHADGKVKTGTCGHRYRLRVRATLGVVPS